MKLLPTLFVTGILVFGSSVNVWGDQKGEKCNSDIQCGYGLQCTDGVCTKKPGFDHGGSGKSGKECNIDADCIGSGKCASGSFGKKYCTGN